MELHTEQLKGFSEKAPEWFERLWSDKPDAYLHLMESVVYETARFGEGVIIGHGSQVLLHDFSCAMHVLVTAQEESRIRKLMRQMKPIPGSRPKADSQKRHPKKRIFPIRLPQGVGRPSTL